MPNPLFSSVDGVRNLEKDLPVTSSICH